MRVDLHWPISHSAFSPRTRRACCVRDVCAGNYDIVYQGVPMFLGTVSGQLQLHKEGRRSQASSLCSAHARISAHRSLLSSSVLLVALQTVLPDVPGSFTYPGNALFGWPKGLAHKVVSTDPDVLQANFGIDKPFTFIVKSTQIHAQMRMSVER